ncbi:GumC family protein [Agrobacterium sp. ES01]|uniref:GumC family protein n=1 Tax=Agrobacterium sp. ES01 TaxID=3420714 RepID=UPI003D0BDF6E
MTGFSNAQQDVDIDLAQLFRAVWRRKGRILAVTCLVGGLACVGSTFISPRYESETRILIEPSATGLASNPNIAAAEMQPMLDELNVGSQVQLLSSVDLIKQVARDLDLYQLSEFDPDIKPSALSDVLVLLGIKKNPMDLAPEDRVVKNFQQKLQVYQVEKSRVIGVKFSSKDPKLAAAIPNKIAEVYQSLQSGAKLDSTSDAARWLEPEIANLRDKVNEAERKVAEYRGNSGLLRTSDTQSFATQQLNDVSLELARVRAQQADAEAKAESVRAAIKAGKPTDSMEAVASSPVVQRLKETESGIRSQLTDLQTTLLDGHPRLKALRAQLAGIRQQIAQESLSVASSLENEAGVAKLREAQLLQQLNRAKADSAQAVEDEVGLKALEREATAQRQLLETYLARYREATSRLDKGASPADARVISKASEPAQPSFPKIVPITIVAAVATFVLSAIIVMLSELFSGRALRPVYAEWEQEPARDEIQPERQIPQVALSAAPAVAAQTEMVTPAPPPLSREAHEEAIPASMLDAEPDEQLAAEMEKSVYLSNDASDAEDTGEFSIGSVASYLIDEDVRVAFAISPSGDDGSTATVMLAREIAETGRRVILIDMTGSGCPTALMAANAELPGITDLLCSAAEFSDVMHPDRLSAAHIVPQGTSDIRQAMRGADRLSIVTDALADVYDLVLIECGPARPEGVARLSRNGAHEVIVSAPNPDRDLLASIMEQFEKVGYGDLILMCANTVAMPIDGRHAA